MIQRYGWSPGYADEPGEFEEMLDGNYVHYSDHVAAIAARDALLRSYVADCATCRVSELPVRCPTCVKAMAILGDGTAKQGEE